MITVSKFPHCCARQPTLVTYDQWSDFVDYLEGRSKIGANPSDKKYTPLVSPACYPDGATRSKKAVSEWQWFAADIDNKERNQNGSSMLDVAAKMEESGHSFVIYSTTSNQEHAHCFRLMFPLKNPVQADKFSEVWLSINKWLGGVIDPQTKDMSRILIEPRKWDGSVNVFFRGDDGEPVDAESLLQRFPQSPEEKKEHLVTSLENDPVLSLRRKLRQSQQCSSDVRIITAQALERFHSSREGGRMFSFLLSVASVAELKGYDLSLSELVEIGMDMAHQCGRQKTNDIEHDAANALRKAGSIHTTRAAHQFVKMADSL